MRVIRLFAGTLTVEKGVMWEHKFLFFCSKPQISTKTGSLRFEVRERIVF
jgi:hypothetical protein